MSVARGETTGQIPVALIVDSPWMPGFFGMDMLDFFLRLDRWLETHLDIVQRFPDVVFVPGFWVEYGMAAEPSAYGAPIMWRHDAPPAMRHMDLLPDKWADLPRPDPHADGLMPLVLRRLVNLEQNGELPEPYRIHIVAARGPLALATHVLGTTPFLEATATEPEAVHHVLDIFTDLVIAFLQAQLDCLREPQGILLLDDIVGMLSPRAFKRIALPYLQRMFNAFDGLLRIYHNDTPCAHLLPHLPEAGFDVFNFSHEIDIADAQSALGPNIALMGNVAPLHVLAEGTPEQVETHARQCIEKTGGTGLILSAGGGVSPGTPAENIDALVRAVQNS
ncbi:MAG: uroporphyrinogen decarboxylase family protein [Anaerolineae bacterium]|nr:uroporphyrinogen decarboxylase family protein [Anaerolineae bacterium]